MITRDELHEELARFPTREELYRDFPTRADLREEFARLTTREELDEKLARFATKEELERLREETAAGFADLRRYMEILYEDLKGTLRTVLETIVGRLDARDVAVDRRLDHHEQRLTHVEGRVTSLEHNHRQ